MKTLSEYIEDMLLYKESIGYSRKSYEYDLNRFCRFIESNGLDTPDLGEDIAGLVFALGERDSNKRKEKDTVNSGTIEVPIRNRG